MIQNILAFIIDDFKEFQSIKTLHARPDYLNLGGHDKNFLYYPADVKGRIDFIINMALQRNLFADYEYILFVNGKSDITEEKVLDLVIYASSNDLEMVVPMSNRLSHQSLEKEVAYYAYVELDCFLIRTKTLSEMGGFERKFCHETAPEMFVKTYYTVLAYFDLDFCLKLWQQGVKIAVYSQVKIHFAPKQELVYQAKQINGGKDAVWYYRKLLVEDVLNCPEGLANIDDLLKNRTMKYYPEPDINKDFNLEVLENKNRKLILVVLPQYLHFVKNNISEDSFNNIYKIYELFFHKLEEQGYTVRFASESLLDDAAAIFFMVYPLNIFDISYRVHEFTVTDKYVQLIKEKKLQYKTILLGTSEPKFSQPNFYKPETHDIFSYCLTMKKDLVDDKKYFYCPAILDYELTVEEPIPFDQKKLLTFVYGGYFRDLKINEVLYPKRLEVVEYFNDHHPNEFEFYGYNWPNGKYHCYKGAVENRFEIFKQYKFVITYVNYYETIHDFLDPRFFDAMISGSIPIYLGAPDINDLVPDKVIIDPRNFKNYEELYQFISQMSEETYDDYLKNIKKFVCSKTAQNFSLDKAVSCVVDIIHRI